MVGENCSITKLWGISKPDLKPTEADAKILVGFGRGQTWHARSRRTFLVHKTRAVGRRMQHTRAQQTQRGQAEPVPYLHSPVDRGGYSSGSLPSLCAWFGAVEVSDKDLQNSWPHT